MNNGKTGNKNVQIVLQHCCSLKSDVARFITHVPVLQQIKVAAGCVNNDFSLDKIT